jgi:hypothetical protein
MNFYIGNRSVIWRRTIFYFWHRLLSEQRNRQKLLDMSITFSLALIIVNNLGLTAVRANEPIQPIELHQHTDIKSSDRA